MKTVYMALITLIALNMFSFPLWKPPPKVNQQLSRCGGQRHWKHGGIWAQFDTISRLIGVQ